MRCSSEVQLLLEPLMGSPSTVTVGALFDMSFDRGGAELLMVQAMTSSGRPESAATGFWSCAKAAAAIDVANAASISSFFMVRFFCERVFKVRRVTSSHAECTRHMVSADTFLASASYILSLGYTVR
ncbi:MAG: hypothetical protein RIQ72_220 [Candidatus Parcubacteria bacterium]